MADQASVISLNEAIEKLKKYYPITGRDQFVDQQVNSPEYKVELASEVKRAFLSFLDGGMRIKKALQTVSSDAAWPAEIPKILKVYCDLDPAEFPAVAGNLSEIIGKPTTDNPSSPTKDDGMGVIMQVLPVGITPANRFTDAAALFLTAVPSLEMSRAVPYLNLRVLVPREPLDGTRPLSNYSFLFGKADPTSDLMKKMISSDSAELLGTVRNATEGIAEEAAVTYTVAGMELFTSPQTMINADPIYNEGSGRVTPVIDPFRPFLTIKSIEFNVVPTVGMMSYKSAKLQLTLHDRSRMSDISDLIRPDLYGYTQLLIEYGWSHPDGNAGSNNAYGQLINNMRAKEKYGIVNSSFVFSEAGQVDITLELFMKGIVDFQTVQICQTKEITSLVKTITELTYVISDIRSRLIKTPSTKEVRGLSIFDSSSDISTALQFPTSALKELKEYLKTPPAGEAGSDEQLVYNKLLELYGENGEGGQVGELNTTLADQFKLKIDSLKTTSDPMLEQLTAQAKKSENSAWDQKQYTSLAKALYHFVVDPLLTTNNYDEIHLIFYPFNSGAGAVKDANIGSFPIRITDFQKSFDAYTKKRGKFNISLREFIDWLSNNFIDDLSNSAYGMSDLYSSQVDKDTGEVLVTPADGEKDVQAINSTIEKRMREVLQISDGVFRMPQLDLFVEAVAEAEGLENAVGDPQTTLLRIHVFDKQTSPYLALIQLLDAMLDNNLGTFGEASSTSDDPAEHAKHASEIIAAALDADLLVVASETAAVKTYRMSESASVKGVKEFVSKTAPSLRYGTNTSGMKTVSIRSLQDPLLTTIHMQRANTGDPNAPGVDGGIVPMQMLPTELDMDTFGCPLINFGQQFFIDMDTGTTIDNIYGVTKLTHKIEQGKFDSSFTMINIDAYGKYRSAFNAISQAINYIESLKKDT